jgi:maltooligosyltrehalose trehalohydrolase
MIIGANYSDNGTCEFAVWAPFADTMSLHLYSPDEKTVAMHKEGEYWKISLDTFRSGTQYRYQINRQINRADPASYYQPDGVHGASQVINHSAFAWTDTDWKGVELSEMILYEIHVGTFTPEGTFEAIIPRLDSLKQLGINAIEIMPVAQFPGERNWGYDGVFPFAVQSSYGGPEGLKKFVNACHSKEVSVILDVVYNHLGPEGNYLRDFGPYFSDRYRTHWGEAMNFDGPYSDEVRNFFIENALSWFQNYHIDGLRLDAIHGIYDMSAQPFLLELSDRVREFSRQQGRVFYLIAESDLNDAYAIRLREKGGYGLDASWNDDFHHAVHTLLTEENDGYYMDFGRIKDLEKSLTEGFVYSGQHSPFRKRKHGNSSSDIPADRFVVFAQNHDQTGNRMNGDRLSSLVSFEALKLVAGSVMLSPYIPLLFMGEEYGETSPFLYFISHSDPGLVEAVRKGRKEGFKAFHGNAEHHDPQAVETFERSRVKWHHKDEKHHRILWELYAELIRVRRTVPALATLDNTALRVVSDEEQKVLVMKRWRDTEQILAFFNFSKHDVDGPRLFLTESWKKVLDSSDHRWNGPGTLLPESLQPDDQAVVRAESFALYINEH